jgi:hypothetical protein
LVFPTCVHEAACSRGLEIGARSYGSVQSILQHGLDRLSEAMAIERDDVDLDMGVLTVRLTKFGKSRLVPLHPTTSAALSSYAKRRDAHLGPRCGSTFFVAEQGGRLLHQYGQADNPAALRRTDERPSWCGNATASPARNPRIAGRSRLRQQPLPRCPGRASISPCIPQPKAASSRYLTIKPSTASDIASKTCSADCKIGAGLPHVMTGARTPSSQPSASPLPSRSGLHSES